MPSGIILYQSKYGATKKYVDWLIQKTNFDSVPTKEASIQKAAQYDIVILAGGIYASGIAGLSFLKKNKEAFQGNKAAVFCVGASPYEEKAIQEIVAHNFKEDFKGIPCYYGRGMWDEAGMTFRDRTLCKMLKKAVAKQDPSTYEPWQKALLWADKKCDWTDERYLDPLLEWIGRF